MSVPAATNAVTRSAPSALAAIAPNNGGDAALFQLLLGNTMTPGSETPTPQSGALQSGALPTQAGVQTGLDVLSLQADGTAATNEDATQVAPDSKTLALFGALDGASAGQPAANETATPQATAPTPQQTDPQASKGSQPGALPIEAQIAVLQAAPQTTKGAQPAAKDANPAAPPTDSATGDDVVGDNATATPTGVAGQQVAVTLVAATAGNAQIAQTPTQPGAKTAEGDEPVVDSAFGAKAGVKKASVTTGGAKQAANAPNVQANANTSGAPRPPIVQPVLDSAASPTTLPDSAISYPGAADTQRISTDPAAASFSRPTAPNPAALSLAQQIVRRFDGGNANFQVRLDPPELGRVDVRLTVDKDKRVTAKIGADSPATLSELRGAAREIERALADAGLNVTQDGLSFDLNDRSQPNDGDNAFGATTERAANEQAPADASAPLVSRPFGLERWSASGVDVWA